MAKISTYPSITPTADDLLLGTNDPAGTPATRNFTAAAVRDFALTSPDAGSTLTKLVGLDGTTPSLFAPAAARAGLGVGIVLDSTATQVDSTNSATTLFDGVKQLPANDAELADLYIFRSFGGLFNAEGNTRTITLAHSFAGTTTLTSVAVSIANGTLFKQWLLETWILWQSVSATSTVQTFSRLWVSGDNSEAGAVDRGKTTQITNVNAGAAQTFVLTAQPQVSSANLVAVCTRAMLFKNRRAF